MAAELRRPLGLGRGPTVVGLLVCAGLLAAWSLELSFTGLLPHSGGREIAAEFFRAALSPATSYQVDTGAGNSFLGDILAALYRTVVFAAAAMSLSSVSVIANSLRLRGAEI